MFIARAIANRIWIFRVAAEDEGLVYVGAKKMRSSEVFDPKRAPPASLSDTFVATFRFPQPTAIRAKTMQGWRQQNVVIIENICFENPLSKRVFSIMFIA